MIKRSQSFAHKICYSGSESETLAAKDAILKIVSNPGRSRRND